MRKQILVFLCAISLFALGCKDPVVKTEMDKASEEMKKTGEKLSEAGHEAAEAARAGGRAAEAAGHEAASELKGEVEHAKSTIGGNGTTPETPPDQK